MHLPRRHLAHERLPTKGRLDAIESGANQELVRVVLRSLALVEDGLVGEEHPTEITELFLRAPENLRTRELGVGALDAARAHPNNKTVLFSL
jgi:hypothetical protein